MKVSLNAVKGFTGVGLPVGKLVELIGARLGAVEEVIDLGAKYRGIVIVKVVSCVKHPNADKLSLCLVDDGGKVKGVERDDNGHVQIVCGAPNVREGMLAAWLPPGSTVPSTIDKEPFVLEARELRGRKSNGMLASPKELALGDSHEGLLALDDGKPGDDFASTYGLDDYVIDIENKMFTHRPDCFGYLGVAREIAGIQHEAFQSPDWYVTGPAFPEVETDKKLDLKITNQLPRLVPRFTAITMSGVAVGPSPAWLQVELAKAGQKSINNIVDYTNFFMLQTGQPLHVYDYDKVRALGGKDTAELTIRHPKPGEKIRLLNGKTVQPRAEAMMVATGGHLICLGGAMGGTETEVDDDTRNIIIEAANWDMFNIRRTAMEHGVFTDSVTRFTKGQSPLQNVAAIARMVGEIRAHDSGKVASRLVDDNHVGKAVMDGGSLHPPVTVTTAFVNGRLGLDLSAGEMKRLLENVEFSVETDTGGLAIAAPFWRTDIAIPEDIVEEVGRLYGYDRLPLSMPRRDLTPAPRDPLLDVKAEVRARLSKAGANEVLTYSFVRGDLLDKTGQDRDKAFEIANALSPDLQYYRISLMPSLLEKVHPNIKAGYGEFALFEIGKGHNLEDKGRHEPDLPGETELTGLVVTADDKLKRPGAAYYQARAYLEALAGTELAFKPVGKDMQGYPIVKPYDMDRTALVSVKGGDFLGIIGEFRPGVRRALKLPRFTAGFEIDTTVLRSLPGQGTGYVPLFRFPGVKQDITLKVAADLDYGQLYEFLDKELALHAPDGTYITLNPIDIYQKKTDTRHKQVTFRVSITDPRRTLTDKEVVAVLDAVAATAKSKLKAERI